MKTGALKLSCGKNVVHWIRNIQCTRFFLQLNFKAPIQKEKGFVLFSSIPSKDTTGTHERLKLACKNGEIISENEDAVSQILKVLDNICKRDDLSLTFETWSTFIKLRKKDTDSMAQFITNYDRKVNELKRDGIVLPETVLALQLQESVYLERKERQLVLTAVDYSQKETMYEQMRKALINFQGEEFGPQKGASMTFRVKEELVNTSENEDVLYSRRSLGQTSFNNRGRMTKRGRTSTNWSRGRRNRGSGPTSKNVRKRPRFLNPKDVDGNILRCNVCDSIYHFAKGCPEGWENINKVIEDGEAWDVNLAMGDQQVFMCETVNAAVLDSACTKTVTGRAWKDTYLKSLSNEEISQIKTLPGGTVFRFDGEMKKESSEKLILPCTIAGRKVMIQTNIVVDSDIPLLLSKPDMKRLRLQLNMENDIAKIFDKVIVGTTLSGHYLIPIRDCNIPIEVLIPIDVHFAIEDRKIIEQFFSYLR